ncbi:hypothetical protein SAMN05216404_106188 [Nitrosospira multiformis]|uniref:SMODS and SLOG-associating 2TM effector domain-containing protein n=1 Tax=Nitrosospira multiformis TaxID=1231 RepID=A0A1H8IUS3_9PROT|nr:hypothetical protein [Nitrosospira multiformis]SEN72181.1 hypothetical protein SAMN05216404_106188 [Nitrosospira multiformis]
MEKTRDELLGEIRYAIRLAERTARLYRRVQTFSSFCAIMGGSAALAGVSDILPQGALAWGSMIAASFGAMLLSVRPGDKAAQNEADIKRFQLLMSRSSHLQDEELAASLEETRVGVAPEIELLRNVAYNDVVSERNREDAALPLTLPQKLLRAVA